MKNTRIAVINTVRTPFVKSFGVYEYETPLSLSQIVAKEVIEKSGVKATDIGECFWGAVIPQMKNPNIARDIILFSGLPRHITGFTLNKACTSSLQSILIAHDSIKLGRYDVVLAGGVEVLTDVPIVYSDDARRFLTGISKARSLGERLSLIAKVKLKSFLPVPPALAESFTGLTMGEHAEIMTVKNNISRERQDEFSLQSHKKTMEAQKKGYFDDEIVPVFSGKTKKVLIAKDNLIREDISLEGLSKLRPAFDKKHGTITAGNASPLTDGASASIIASEAYAIKNNLPILGFLKDAISFSLDPNDQLLIGPAYAIPKLLAKNNLTLADIGVFEIHEAFAGQVLSCLDSMNNETFCREKLGMPKFGAIDEKKLNIDGGAIAIGHPFGATGARLVGRALRIAKRKNEKYAVIAICAAGGMAMAALLETN